MLRLLNCLKFPFAIVVCILIGSNSHSQNTTNKGTDFWLGYMAHRDSVNSNMSLYITSDVSTSGVVSIPLQGWTFNFTVTANTTTIVDVPAATAYVHCSDCVVDRGIHVTADLPVVVYSHIYHSQRSDATLVLPVPTLGKEYYAMSFTQNSVGVDRLSEFLIVAVEDNTEVEVIPTQNTVNGNLAGIPFTVSLMQGQVYQVQSASDLTGSHIESVSSGTGSCKRIAVFSGSMFDALGCASASSGDNLYQQLYSINAWGSNFVTAPYKTRLGGDYFRVLSKTDNTSVVINGAAAVVLNNGQFYDFLSDVPNYITSTQPITVAQFQRTQTCDDVTGDPSMTILNPVEQTLNSITLYSSPFQVITGQYINVIMKTAHTGSFLLDGSPVTFLPVATNPIYSYSQNTVNAGNHTLTADSGFNAIAYGFGNLESYSYNAGANVQNLDQVVNASSNGISGVHNICEGVPVTFDVTTTYNPTSWLWYFGDGSTSTDSLPTHVYTNADTFIVSLVTTQSNDGGCDAYDSTVYELVILPLPTAAFVYANTCINDTVDFTDVSILNGGGITGWLWRFGDGDSSVLQNPSHRYEATGTYNATLQITSASGCTSSVEQVITIHSLPIAEAGEDTLICFGSSTTFSATGGVIYSWGPNVGLSSASVSNPTATPSSNMTYTVTVTDANGCTDSDSVTVELLPAFTAIAGPDTAVCVGEKIALFATNGISYNWQPSSYLDDPTLASPQAIVLSSVTYTVLIENSDRCKLEKTVVINVHDLPKIAVTSDTFVCKNFPLQLTATGAVNYVWSGGSIAGCSDCDIVEVGTLEGGSYTVVGTDENNCTGNASVTVTINNDCQSLIMPGAFTPNGDGVNDLYRPVGFGITSVEYSVYNRWGQKLFTGRDLTNGWNGTFNGAAQPIGTYTWTLSATLDNGKQVTQQGNVSLIK